MNGIHQIGIRVASAIASFATSAVPVSYFYLTNYILRPTVNCR